MCVVSMIIDHYRDKWDPKKYPAPYTPPQPWTIPPSQFPPPAPKIPSKEEIEEFYELLRKAREYDKKNNEPDCELESKKKQLIELAEQLGITIKFE